jgi:pimeloyl-ACP methyl ester carboxylesterase
MLTHISRSTLMFSLAVATALTACASPTVSQTPSNRTGPQFTDNTAQCPWNLADLRAQLPGLTIRCGTINVPEFHSRPEGTQLQLAVLVAQHGPGRPSPDAVIYLAGGPGNRIQVPVLSNFWDAGRDVILFDQRGVGYSTPALNCSVVGGRDPLGAVVESQPALAACRDELVRQGVNLAAYTIPEAAADINDIRQALGYRQLDLYGLSYGTKLALAVLRDYPQVARSVVLDSVLPIQADVVADLPANIERSLTLAIEACAADPACRQAHSDLKPAFFQLVAQLNGHPAALTIGGSSTVAFTGDSLARLLLALLIDGPGQFPAFVDRLRQNDLSQLSQMLSDMQQPSDGTAWVMSFAVVCSDAEYGSSSSIAVASANVTPGLRDPLRTAAQAVVALCDAWPAPKLDATNTQPVRSDVPALVLEGAFDPITPPAYGRLAAETLPHSFYVEFPDRGHAVLRGGNDCSQQIVNQFLQQPTIAPDIRCATALRPVFDAGQIGKLGPGGFSLSRDGILSAVAPELHLTVAQLDQALGSGRSLDELAQSQGVAVAQVKQALRAEIRNELSAQVQAGNLSQADAVAISQKFEQGGLDQLLNDQQTR